MDAHPEDFSLSDDLVLLGSARAGDRLAFGILYLRHHAAAWRVACIASRFSPDAELAVIEGFTRVFSALPAESEEFEAGLVTFRPYLLACVRQSALDRAEGAGRAEADRTGPGRGAAGPPASPPPPAALAGLTVDGEVRLTGLEHHVARGALAALGERARTALWLTDVESMTPDEVAGILGGPPEEVVELATGARGELRTGAQTALDRQEVRAECRFAAEHLPAYEAGTLDPAAGLLVRAHLTDCLACRMRQGELSNAPAALAAAVPAAPLLGGEAQHHWLAQVSDVRPAERLLPPILAAGGAIPRASLARRTATHLGTMAGAAAAPARRVPDVLRRAGRAAAGAWHGENIDLTTKPARPRTPRPPAPQASATEPTHPGPATEPAPPGFPTEPTRPGPATEPTRPGPTVPALAGGLPRLARRIRRTALPVLPAMALAVAWVLVMLALPRLMAPSTAPGPGGLALPPVRAYLPGFWPGSERRRSTSKAAVTAPGPSAIPPLAAPAIAVAAPVLAVVASVLGMIPAVATSPSATGIDTPVVPHQQKPGKTDGPKPGKSGKSKGKQATKPGAPRSERTGKAGKAGKAARPAETAADRSHRPPKAGRAPETDRTRRGEDRGRARPRIFTA